MLAIYRAGQDARGAIRSIIKRQQLHSTQFSSDPYQIDINNIFVGGISAGSVIAMNAVYYQNQDMINAAFPNVINALGAIEQNFYFADTTVEFASRIKGVVNMWGALLIPLSYQTNPADFFSSNESYIPPVISFCGKGDPIFHYTHAGTYFSPAGIYKGIDPGVETNCLLISSFSLPDNGATNKDLQQLGSSDIYDMFRTLQIPAEFYLDCTMMHGLDDDCVSCVHNGPKTFYKTKDGCTACVFDSDFGTGLSNSDDVNTYMVERGATFFQGAMGGILSSLIITKFVECENYRNKCTTGNNNACPYTTVENQDTYDCTDWEQ